MVRDAIQKRPVLTYFILAFILGIVAISLRGNDPNFLAGMMRYVQENHVPGNVITVLHYSATRDPSGLLILLFPAVPTIAALIIVAFGWGASGLKELFSRFRPWREGVTWRQGLKVYGGIAAVYLAIAGFVFLSVEIYGAPGSYDNLLETYGKVPVYMALMLLVLPFFDGGGLLEELGWRGYALPRMLRTFKTPLMAAVLLGLFWGFWHISRDFPVFFAGAEAINSRFGGLGHYLIHQLTFYVGTVCLTIIATYVFNRTGGSVLPAIMVHGAGNTISVNTLMFAGLHDVVIWGIRLPVTGLFDICIALAICLLVGPQLGRRGGSNLECVTTHSEKSK